MVLSSVCLIQSAYTVPFAAADEWLGKASENEAHVLQPFLFCLVHFYDSSELGSDQ